MPSNSALNRDIEGLKKAVASLQREFSEFFTKHAPNEAKLASLIESRREKEDKTRLLMKCLKYLMRKVNDQNVRIETLMNILGLKIQNKEDCLCEKNKPFVERNPTVSDKKEVSQNKIEASVKKNRKTQKMTYTNDLLEQQREANENYADYCHILSPMSTFLFDTSSHYKRNVSNNENATWTSIMNGDSRTGLSSPPVLLPDDIGGLIVTLGIHGFSREQFRVSVQGLRARDALPIKFYLSVLIKGEKNNFRSKKHKFTVKDFSPDSAQPDDFLIPIRGLNCLRRPVIEFKFDAVPT